MWEGEKVSVEDLYNYEYTYTPSTHSPERTDSLYTLRLSSYARSYRPLGAS